MTAGKRFIQETQKRKFSPIKASSAPMMGKEFVRIAFKSEEKGRSKMLSKDEIVEFVKSNHVDDELFQFTINYIFLTLSNLRSYCVIEENQQFHNNLIVMFEFMKQLVFRIRKERGFK